MSEVSGKAFESSLLKRISSFTKPYRRIFYIAVLLTVLIALVAPLRPLLTQYTLDNHVPFGNMRVDIRKYAKGLYYVVLNDSNGNKLASAAVEKL